MNRTGLAVCGGTVGFIVALLLVDKWMKEGFKKKRRNGSIRKCPQDKRNTPLADEIKERLISAWTEKPFRERVRNFWNLYLPLAGIGAGIGFG